MSQETMLSRSGRTDPDGKLDARIDVPMPERLESQIITAATLQGVTKAEWIRRTCDKELNGSFNMLRRMAQGAGMFNGINDGSNSDADAK
jgi:hypothetical protein